MIRVGVPDRLGVQVRSIADSPSGFLTKLDRQKLELAQVQAGDGQERMHTEFAGMYGSGNKGSL